MRITLAALFVLGCSPVEAPADASLTDVEIRHSDECSAGCAADGWEPCVSEPGSAVDCTDCFVHDEERPFCADPEDVGGFVTCFCVVE